MDEFKDRWQALQSIGAGSRLAGGALARSVAECFMAGYQIALDRTFHLEDCLLYTSPSPRDRQKSRMPSSA